MSYKVYFDFDLLSYLILGSKAEKTVAAEALWVLAFSEKNKKKILADSDVMKSLNDYTKAINVP